MVQVDWDRPITLQEWTTVIAVDVCNAIGVPILTGGPDENGNRQDRADYGFLPDDVNQSSQVSPADLLLFRQIFGDIEPPPCGPDILFIDINRSLNVSPADLLKFR